MPPPLLAKSLFFFYNGAFLPSPSFACWTVEGPRYDDRRNQREEEEDRGNNTHFTFSFFVRGAFFFFGERKWEIVVVKRLRLLPTYCAGAFYSRIWEKSVDRRLRVVK